MLTLRPATMKDESRLLAWRNDPVTRSSSFTAHEITPAEHHAWLESKLADPGSAPLIIEKDGRAVGQVRLDRVSRNLAEVHIAVAPEARSGGIAREALRLALEEAPARVGVKRLQALVKVGNESALGAFRAAGFLEVERRGEVVELRHRGTR